MGNSIKLTSKHDGFSLSAYHAPQQDARRGGLLLIQEIFGVTDHIRELADGFAADGYEVIAPGFYDRLEPGFEADYSPESIQKGVQYSNTTPWDQVAGDCQAAIDQLRTRGPVFVAGYCWGGAATWHRWPATVLTTLGRSGDCGRRAGHVGVHRERVRPSTRRVAHARGSRDDRHHGGRTHWGCSRRRICGGPVPTTGHTRRRCGQGGAFGG